MQSEKMSFLHRDLINLLKKLSPDAKGKWGVMNGHEMVEHMIYTMQIANGRKSFPLQIDEERLKKNYAFMMSEKDFRENTKNLLLRETPMPPQHKTIDQSLDALQKEIDHFFHVYESQPGLRILNPFFGNLNFEEQVQLLYKHSRHHLRQFGLVE
jgi:hypothetical protein